MAVCPKCGGRLETVFTIEERCVFFDVVDFEVCRNCKIGFRGGIVETFETYEEAEEFIKQVQSVVEDLSGYALLP